MLLFIGFRIGGSTGSAFSTGSQAAKKMFLDRDGIIKRVGKQKSRFLAWAGASVRTTARRSMRSVKSPHPSLPGTPPRSRTGLIKKLLFFFVDKNKQTVLVGPTLANGKQTDSVPVPQLHEEGGTVTRQFAFIANPDATQKDGADRFVTLDNAGRFREQRTGKFVNKRDIKRIVSSKRAKPRRVTYPPRPFMQPALEKTEPKLAQFWADSIK
jgi:hypothetical protein